MVLKYDEEADETGFDDRFEDDIEKGRIKFSRKKLHGREDELNKLHSIFDGLCEKPYQARVVFLAGYSGTGKSALVEEFTKEISQKSSRPYLISGKYDELQSADPYSAIAAAINRFCSTLAKGDMLHNTEFEQLKDQLKNAVGNNGQILTSIVADVSKVIGETSATSSNEENSLCKLKYAFQKFMRAICTPEHPLVMVLDDMQWMDDGSSELLSAFLSDKTLKHLMFVGAFRSNEVDQNRSMLALRTEILKETGIEQIYIPELSQDNIGEFIGESLNLDAKEVCPLAKAIYNKTLGNIFFAMQAIEELVRKNCLYYDIMVFRWQWILSRIELEDELSESVVKMVKSKIEYFPELLQQALTTASFTGSTFDLETLKELLEAQGCSKSVHELMEILDNAVLEGFLVNCAGTQEYTFSHDKIQEAANSYVSGDDRDQLCYHVANVLVKRSSRSDGKDWMLFTAAHHLNSVPSHYLDENALISLVSLNLRAGKVSIYKSAFTKAVESFRSGVACLDKKTRWQKHYNLSLELFNCLLEAEFSLGHHDLAQVAVDEILENATSLLDKCTAQFYYIEIITSKMNRNYVLATQKGVDFLSSHDVMVPSNPRVQCITKEKIKLRSVMGKRSLLDLMDSAPMEDYSVAIMRLLEQLSKCACYTNESMAMFVCLSARRLSFEQGMNKYLPLVLAHNAKLLRKQGKLKEAFKMGEVANKMISEVCEGPSWARGVVLCSGCVSLLRHPFAERIEVFKEAWKVGISCGATEWGFLGAMMHALCHFCSGEAMNALFESKLILYEEESRRLGQPPSVSVTFSIFRQVLLNLQGRGNANPILLKGEGLDEGEVLGRFEGNNYQQTLRDISIFRLMLAYVFVDFSTCEEMIEQLCLYPEFDLPIARQHLRDSFMGLAAFSLATRKGKNNKKYLKIGRHKQMFFQKLAKNGSDNAPPVLLCMKAEEKPTRGNYDKAINACSSSGLLHLEAIMNEHYGMYLLGHNKQKLAEFHLMKASWLFYDWGALGKVNQLKQQHDFLKVVCRQQSKTRKLLQNVASSSFLGDRSFSKTLDDQSAFSTYAA